MAASSSNHHVPMHYYLCLALCTYPCKTWRANGLVHASRLSMNAGQVHAVIELRKFLGEIRDTDSDSEVGLSTGTLQASSLLLSTIQRLCVHTQGSDGARLVSASTSQQERGKSLFHYGTYHLSLRQILQRARPHRLSRFNGRVTAGNWGGDHSFSAGEQKHSLHEDLSHCTAAGN